MARGDERVAAGGREEHRLARARQQLARALPRRDDAVPGADERARRRSETRPPARETARARLAGEPEVRAVRGEPAAARAPSHSTSGARRARPPAQRAGVPQVEDRAAARAARTPALRVSAPPAPPSAPAQRPALAPRRVDRADRQREEQRLAVDRREEERHRKRARSTSTALRATARVVVERDEPVQQHERDAEQRRRREHAADSAEPSGRPGEPGDAADTAGRTPRARRRRSRRRRSRGTRRSPSARTARRAGRRSRRTATSARRGRSRPRARTGRTRAPPTTPAAQTSRREAHSARHASTSAASRARAARERATPAAEHARLHRTDLGKPRGAAGARLPDGEDRRVPRIPQRGVRSSPQHHTDVRSPRTPASTAPPRRRRPRHHPDLRGAHLVRRDRRAERRRLRRRHRELGARPRRRSSRRTRAASRPCSPPTARASGFIQNDVLRTTITSSQIPQSMKDATVAIEDERFYQHKGVDFEGVVRAALKNASSGETLQGGSTLTMQLIRTLYTGSREKTFKRKVREAKLAEELENVHSGRRGKAWILTKYLNSVPYGTNGGQTAVGVQAAARAYFNKPASQLTLAESALLAGLPQAPSQYNPFRQPGPRRRAATRCCARWPTSASSPTRPPAPRSREDARAAAQQLLPPEARELLLRLRLRRAHQALRRQDRARRRADDQDDDRPRPPAQGARRDRARTSSFPGAPSSAIVTIDPSNGHILTMASSAKYQDSKFNIAADAKRQPGSTFKIMALVAAVAKGINPATTSYASGAVQLGPQYGNVTINCYGGKCSGGGSKNLVAGDDVVRQHRLHPPRARPRAEVRRDDGARSSASRRSCRAIRPRRSAACATAARRWRWPTPTRRSPPAAGATSPRRSPRCASPTARSTTSASPQRVKVFDSAAMYEVTKILRGEHQGRHRQARARSAAPPAARPARPTTTRTPGSSATRRGSRPRSGSASRRPTSRWATSSAAGPSTAARSPRRSGATT